MERCWRGHQSFAGAPCRACSLIDSLKPHGLSHLMHMVRLHAQVWSVPMTESEVMAAAREMLEGASKVAETLVGTPAAESPAMGIGTQGTERPRRIAADDLEGVTLGSVTIERRLGAGGMGVVYAGRYRDQPVAVKVLHHVDERSLQRLVHEASAMRQLQSPEFVRMLDLVAHEGTNMLVMDLASGRPLRELMTSPWPVQPALDLVIPIVDAIGRAHEAGVLHSDLKPENILCEQRDGAFAFRILDLGLAIINQRDVEGGQTMEGHIAGTPLYMAPEQTRGKRLDARADVYALGSILYELLTGTNPMLVSGPTREINEIILRKQELPPPPSKLARGISRALDKVCLLALAVDRESRYPSARTFAEALRSLPRN